MIGSENVTVTRVNPFTVDPAGGLTEMTVGGMMSAEKRDNKLVSKNTAVALAFMELSMV
jgi:hypothetical protein